MWQHNPYAVPLLFGALVLVSFAIYAWQYRANRTTTLFIVYTAAVSLGLVGYAGELSFADLPTQIAWAKIEYVVTFLPSVYLLFVLSYTRRIDHPSRTLVVALFTVPVIHTLLAFTNEYHHLIWVSTRTVYVDNQWYFMRTYGRVATIGQILEILAGAAGMVILGLDWKRATRTYRYQIVLLIAAALMPLIGDLFNATRLNPFPPLRLYMLGFALSCIPIGYSLFRYQLLDILPAAYDLVVTSMKDAVIVINIEQRIVSANPSAAQMIGRAAKELVGRPLVETFQNAPEMAQHFLTVRDTHTEVSVGGGETRSVYDLMISPLLLHSGKLAGHVIVLHDITSRKQAELAAQQAAARLEERNRMLDTYSHTVAHDLKSPLHLVLGYIDLLRLEVPSDFPAPLRSYIRQASDATIGMAEMIDNLLLLARLDDIQTVTEVVEVQPVARAAVESLMEHITTRNVEVQLGEALPDVVGYAPWLQHVFSNLISNAIKYIGKNNETPRIVVRGAAHGGIARFEIEDNGLGIAPEAQKILFDKFSRFHKSEAPGSGLGLTIVEMIIQRLGGSLGVTSEPGKGSTFWFELPHPEEAPGQPFPSEQVQTVK